MLQALSFGFALWLGLYLFSRNPAKVLLRLTGLGLSVYALSLAGDVVCCDTTAPETLTLTRVAWFFKFLPAIFWTGALIQLLPEDGPFRTRLDRWWRYGLLPLSLALCLLVAGGDWVLDLTAGTPRAGPGYLIFAGGVLAPLLAGLGVVVYALQSARTKKTLGVILAATLFFTLGIGLLFFPLAWLPGEWNMLLIGIDLVCLGLAVGVLDAFDEGESLLPDMARSFAAALFSATLFGSLMALAIGFDGGESQSLRAVWLATVAAAIATQTFSDSIQATLDRLIFARASRLRQARSDLRAASSALPRLNDTLDPQTLDEAEFVRLTRRAISHLGDLPRLAASPLTRLPVVGERLAARRAHDDALERAAELKAVLTESIARLKPRDKGDFGTSAEWRHYNALYFPYVAGLKPYSRRAELDGLDPVAHKALDWFMVNVPERTLHNWQTSAARLVAQDVRGRNRSA